MTENLPSQIDMLLLEQRLLVSGKLLPDSGRSPKHIETRLAQIEAELRDLGYVGELSCAGAAGEDGGAPAA